MLVIFRVLLLLTCLPILALQVRAQAQVAYQKTISAVVEVLADDCRGGNRSGSGFFWSSRSTVVTALHVVGGCGRISVRYQNKGGASVEQIKFDLARDLALLKLTEEPWPDATFLSLLSNVTPDSDRTVYLVGHPYQINSADAFPFQVLPATHNKGRLKDLLGAGLHPSVAALGIDLNTSILRTQPGPQPGASGAPVVDGSGSLVGIAHGRLNSGVGAIGWLTRSEYLTLLSSKSFVQPRNTPAIDAGFLSNTQVAAARVDNDADAIKCGDLHLNFRWRRKFSALIETHNDPAGLAELTKGADGIGLNIREAEFRIWHERQTGAYIAVPAEWKLTATGDKCIARPHSTAAGSVEIVGKSSAGLEAASAFAQHVESKEKDSVSRGMSVSINLRLFANIRETLTNGAIVDRRAYRSLSIDKNEPVGAVQTSFIKGKNAVAQISRTWLSVNHAMSYGICEMNKWEGGTCDRVKEESLETARGLLAAALSTVPES